MDIQKLIEVHLEWLNLQLSQSSPKAEPSTKPVKAKVPKKKPEPKKPKARKVDIFGLAIGNEEGE